MLPSQLGSMPVRARVQGFQACKGCWKSTLHCNQPSYGCINLLSAFPHRPTHFKRNAEAPSAGIQGLARQDFAQHLV